MYVGDVGAFSFLAFLASRFVVFLFIYPRHFFFVSIIAFLLSPLQSTDCYSLRRGNRSFEPRAKVSTTDVTSLAPPPFP